MTKISSIFWIVLLPILAACATANRGSHDYFRIDTVPQGAEVTLLFDTIDTMSTLNRTCPATPCVFQVDRRSEFIAAVALEGYEPVEVFLTHSSKRASFSGSVAANAAVSSGTGAGAGYVAGSIAGSFFNAVSAGSTSGSSSLAGSAAASGAAAGLAVGAGFLAVDQMTGTSQFVFPNPVVLELVPEGGDVIVDQGVVVFRHRQDLENQVASTCAQYGASDSGRRGRCEASTRRKLYQESTVLSNDRKAAP